jgi:methylmalonyl-CoA mutase
MYQRSKIQEESLYYEQLKHSGQLPIIGVNTFLRKDASGTILPGEVIRATEEEKEGQILRLREFQSVHQEKAREHLKKIQDTALENDNVFEELMEASKYCSIGQLTEAMFEVGGRYRRNM